MIVKHGESRSVHGPGVTIELTGDEVARAIDTWLVAQDVHVSGPRTITVNGDRCGSGRVYVDPSGFVIENGKKISGRGPGKVTQKDFWPSQKDWPSFLSIKPGTRVRATTRRSGKNDYTEEAIVARTQHDGGTGEACEYVTGHGVCYGVRFEDGEIAYFDPEELEILP